MDTDLQANLPIEKPAGDHVATRVEGKLQRLLRELNGLHSFRFLIVSVHLACLCWGWFQAGGAAHRDTIYDISAHVCVPPNFCSIKHSC